MFCSIRLKPRNAAAPILTVLTVLGIALSARAHSNLKSSYPLAGSSLPKAPQNLVLTFTAPIEPSHSHFYLEHVETKSRQELKPQIGNNGEVAEFEDFNRDPGRYKLLWTVFAKDGHRTKGEVSFVVRDSE